MIDITTITYDVLPDTVELNNDNLTLKKNNQTLKYLLAGVLIIGLAAGIIILNKLKNDAE